MKYINADLKKLLSLLLFFVSTELLFSQESGINLINNKTNRNVFFKENWRVLVKTTDGKSFKGRFKVNDEGSIIVGRKDTISIDSVSNIKRRSLGLAFTSGLIVGGIGTPIIVASAATGGIVLIVLPLGIAIDAVGFVIPALPRGHSREKWTYSIVK
jgi:hypothetical protein